MLSINSEIILFLKRYTFDFKSVLSNLGKVLFFVLKSLVANVGILSVPVEYWNSKSFIISVTVYCPLNPLLADPTGFEESVTFFIVTSSSFDKLWGFSALIVTIFVAVLKVQELINLKLRSKSKSALVKFCVIPWSFL